MNESVRPSLDRRVELALLVAILLIAAFLRLWRLDQIPPGWTHDEAGHGHDAVAILNGARPIYQTVGYGREPLYDYAAAGLMALIGPHSIALRLVSVALGLLTLLLTFAWARLAFDGPTALIAVALQAASFWSLTTARQALRSTLLPALWLAAVYFYWRLVHAPRSRWAMALCAVFIGATLYTYLPARVLWLIFPLFLVYLALAHRPTFKQVWPATVAGVLTGLALFAPLLYYLRAHPDAEQRLAMLDAPLQALQAGDVSVILGRAWDALAAFLIPGRGDTFLAYTLPGRPLLDPLTGVLFLAGIGLCLARWREPARAFALIWLVVGIAPSLVTGAAASITRSIAAMPVVFLFPALAAVAGLRWLAKRWGTWGGQAGGIGLIMLVVTTGAISARDYFVAWGESPDVRAAYQHTLTEIAAHLDARPESGTVAISTVYPLAPHDPYVFEMSLRRRDLALRWFDARAALILPSTATARLIVPHSAPLDPYFAELPGLHMRERIVLRPTDLDPAFSVYAWQPRITLAALQKRAGGQALPVNFGDTLQFLGYDLYEATGRVELLTLWQVTDPQALQDPSGARTELALFTHALDAAGKIIGQQDRLDAPAWDWQAGDVIAQLHRFALPPDLAPQSLEVGVYRLTDLTRLPVMVNGAIVDDRILLQPVQIK